MAEILPINVMAEKIAKQALDEYEYKGKTIREWIDALASTEVSTLMSLANSDKVKQDFKQDIVRREDVSIWLNMWEGYLDEDMIGRMQIALKRDVPSAQKKGKWIPSDVPESTLCKCDQCGWDMGAYCFNYCPNCGAEMRPDYAPLADDDSIY